MGYGVVLQSDAFRFRAAHFVAFPIRGEGDEGQALAENAQWLGERLHEHDFHVALRIVGPLDDADCVVDFIAAKRALLKTLKRWDGKTLLARNTPRARYRESPEQDAIEIEWRGAPQPLTFTAPLSSVLWLDATNASAEIIAAKLLLEWLDNATLPFPRDRYSLTLRLEESPGCFVEASL